MRRLRDASTEGSLGQDFLIIAIVDVIEQAIHVLAENKEWLGRCALRGG